MLAISEVIEHGGRVVGVRVKEGPDEYSVLRNGSGYKVYRVVANNILERGYQLNNADIETEKRVLQGVTLGRLEAAFNRWGTHGLVEHDSALQAEDVF